MLGYHKLDSEDIEILKSMFIKGNEIPLSNKVKDKAIELKQIRKMSLGDSIIAASALTQNVTLVTRNTNDFDNIKDLKLLNPYEKQP